VLIIAASERHAVEVRSRTLRATVLLLVAATLLAVVVAAYIRRSVTRPVEALSAGALRLARGDLDARMDTDMPLEFAHLAIHWNAMTAAIKEHQARLVQSEKLAGIGRLAAGVAHEINNPLGVILGYARVLRRKADGPLAEDLGVIEDESLRCQEIVEGLVDLARPLPIHRAPLEMRELSEDVVARLSESRRVSQANVSVEGSAVVEADPRRIRQVLLNLIQNAMEAAGERGHVRVEIADGADVRVAVSDDGPGVCESDEDRLFEPFFTTKPEGTGLGLAVSQAIARAHGGSIAIDRPPGGGARFTLLLRQEGGIGSA
jgi:signal transduction histidine kinase